MQEVYDFLKKCGTYYLATDDNGQPRVRPFGTVDLFDGMIYIQTGKKKEVSEQMARNPRIEICAFDGDIWLRVEATAVNDDNREAKQHMLDAYPSLKGMYSVDDDNTQVLYLKGVKATFSSFTEAPRTIEF